MKWVTSCSADIQNRLGFFVGISISDSFVGGSRIKEKLLGKVLGVNISIDKGWDVA